MVVDVIALIVVLSMLGAAAYVSSKGDDDDVRRIRAEYEGFSQRAGPGAKVISIKRWRGPRFFLTYTGSYLRKYYVVAVQKDDGTVLKRDLSVGLSLFRTGDIREI